MAEDYLLVAGRMTREGLDAALLKGFVTRMWANQGQVATALVVKTSMAAEGTETQHARLYGAGQVCVHANPDAEIVFRVVQGVLTHDAELLGEVQHAQSA